MPSQLVDVIVIVIVVVVKVQGLVWLQLLSLPTHKLNQFAAISKDRALCLSRTVREINCNLSRQAPR